MAFGFGKKKGDPNKFSGVVQELLNTRRATLGNPLDLRSTSITFSEEHTKKLGHRILIYAHGKDQVKLFLEGHTVLRVEKIGKTANLLEGIVLWQLQHAVKYKKGQEGALSTAKTLKPSERAYLHT